MKRFHFFILLCLLALSVNEPANAQGNNNQSLLWRISGNGLPGTSYLFGTMHVKNNKAFHFKDSLYYFIENTAGFAMEIHPDSVGQILTAVAEGRIDLGDDSWDYSSNFDEKEFDKIIQKIEKDKKLTKKSPKEKISYLMEKLLDSKEENENGMETFMDAYLYGLALQNRKKIFGLEQVEDQILAFRSLMKGIKVNRVSAMAEKGFFRGAPPIYEYYYKENIDSLRSYYTTFFSDTTLKGFLYDRNIGMAHQMDSLANKQTMFFAIGAGHLPGKEGVIALLREKGYTVEPVFSAKKIFAGDYQKKAIVNNWVPYKNESLGFQYEMPGKITTQQGGQGREVSYCYDLPQGMIFMTIAGKLSSAEKKADRDSIFLEHTGVILESMNAHILSQKPIEVKGLKGFELTASSLSNGFSRMVEVFDGKNFYMLSVSAERKDKLENALAAQFINSFESIPAKPVRWNSIDSKNEGFAVEFPGELKTQIVKTDADSKISLNSYTAFDGNSGINYTVYFSRADEGNQLMQGEWFFSSYVQSLKNNMGNVDIEQVDTTLFGYPAKMVVSEPYKGQVTEGIILRRSNTSYLVFAEYDKEEKNEADLKRYFESFRLQAFPKTEWQQATSPDGVFSAWVPGTVTREIPDTTSYQYSKDETLYYATEKYSGATCDIEVATLSKYFWAANEDSVFSYWKNKSYSGYLDSMISYTNTKNGGLPSRELIVYNKNMKLNRRYRLVLSGNKMYTLKMEVAPAFTNAKDDDRFFESFRLAKEEKSDAIFSAGPGLLFEDLLSKDSATFKEAYDALDEVDFRQQHFSLLLQQSLLEYPMYDDMYQTVNQKLLYFVGTMAKESKDDSGKLFEFIRSHYNDSGKGIAGHRFHLLGLLADMKTASSYQLLSELIDNNPPSGGSAYQLFAKLNDSLELSRTLFPGLLKYAADSVSGFPVLGLAKTLIDSNLLTVNDIRAVQPDMIKLAGKSLQSMISMAADEYDYDYGITDVISLLGYLNNKQANETITGFLKVKILYVKKQAVVSLVENGWPVSSVEIKKLAADNEYRAELYEAFVKAKKTSLFPSEFATQQAMGKSYIHKRMVDWDEVEEGLDLIFIKKVERIYKGSKKRFFLFRVNVGDEELHAGDPESPETQTYLAIAGPFELDAKKLLIKEDDNITGAYYDFDFDGLRIDEFFEKFIAAALKNIE